jgi:hypothetical protein
MHVEFYTAIVTRALLVLLYIPVLVRVIRGSSYTPIVRIIILLMLSNVLLLAQERFYYGLWIGTPVYTAWTIWGYAVLVGLGNLAFNVAHLELAWIYRKVAIETPLMIESQDSVAPINDRKSKVVYFWLMVCNVLFPVV